MTRGSCATCFWWDNSASSQIEDDTGQCRGGIPGFDDRSGLAVWPFTLADDWCRHHEPDPQAEDIEPDEDATS